MEELDVATGSTRELLEIVLIDGHDVVAVRGEEHERGVDDIGQTGTAEQYTGCAAEVLVDRNDLDTTQRLSKASLACASTPDLSEDSGVGDRHLARDLRRLQPDPHVPIISLESDQGAAIEHDGHAGLAPVRRGRRPVGCRPPRTTTASSRSALRCACSSSLVISPNSAS